MTLIVFFLGWEQRKKFLDFTSQSWQKNSEVRLSIVLMEGGGGGFGIKMESRLPPSLNF